MDTATVTPRRSRMRRKSTGKLVELTARDLEIFKLLQRYRYLRSTFIHAFVGGASETRFKERLGHLYHEAGYLHRPEQQWQYANARCMPAVYEIGDRADEALRQHGIVENPNTWLSKGRMGAHRQFAHSLMICDVLASIELGVRTDPQLGFISWQQIIAKAPEATRLSANPFQIPVSISYTCPQTGKLDRAAIKLVPDGLFGLEYTHGGQRTYRFFALEADRNNVPARRTDLQQSSYLRKVLAYRHIITQQIYKSHFGTPNLFVLNVMTNERHMRNIMAVVHEMGGSKLLLFKTMSALGDFQKAPDPSPHILTMPWHRAGHESFWIDK